MRDEATQSGPKATATIAEVCAENHMQWGAAIRGWVSVAALKGLSAYFAMRDQPHAKEAP